MLNTAPVENMRRFDTVVSCFIVLFQLNLEINKGKDFTGDHIEINALTDPGTLILFSAAQYELYRRGGHQFLTRSEVSDLLSHHHADREKAERLRLSHYVT